MPEKKLFLLDAMALIYRAHFAFIRTPRITSKGVNTSAVFGFTNSLLEILNKEAPTHLGVAFDTHGPTFRHIAYPDYKGQRDEVPEDIITAIPLVKRLLQMLNIPILELQGFEADDLIGTIAKRAENHGYIVYMVTPDKDFAQLVTEKVLLYKPARMGNGIDILDPKRVEEVMGIPPDKVVDFLGLKGDAVDNIPGIPKVGDKTAIELIKTYGSVEAIVERANEIEKKSIRESVLEFGQQGLLSKQLATIETGVDIPWDEEDLKIGNPDKKGAIDLLNELEFRATAERILSSPIFGTQKAVQTDLFGNVMKTGEAPEKQVHFDHGFASIETRKHDYKLLETTAQVKTLVAAIKKKGLFCFDTETTGLDAMQVSLVAVTFSLETGTAWMLFIPEKTNVKELLEPFKEVWESEKIVKVGQNLKYDMLVLKNQGVEVRGPLFDKMLAHYVLHADRSHGMDALAKEYLQYEAVPISSLIGKKGKGQLTMRHVDQKKLLAYACEDADVTYALYEKLDAEMTDTGSRHVFEKMECPLVHVLTNIEFLGVKVDEEFLNKYSIELDKEIKSIEKEIHEMAGVRFNINSPKQLGEVIFEKLNLAKGKKTKTGQFSTKEEILVELASEHELPAKVLRFRSLGKLKSTYVDALPALINPKTGRVHTTLSQAVASTGRLSSNNPNLQNIPIRSEEGREIRKAFIPEGEDFVLMAADYSQVELRLMAELSQDPGLKEAFSEKQDIHKATASKVFGVPIEEVSSAMRAKAKMVNFGIIYGISAFGLGQRLGISRTEAAEIIEAYFDKYSKVKAFMDESIAFARENGYVTTIMGRRRYLPDINSQNATIRGFAERNAINTPVQGSAADLIKIAMINIHETLMQSNMKSRMILQVHDELLFEVFKPEKEKLEAMVRDKMENALKLSVPMVVDVGYGKNWLEAH